MAGSWIKMRHDLIDAPEVRRLAKALGVTKDDVYGKLFRLWSWFDRHSHNGVVPGEELEAVDDLIGVDGFAAALVSVGWLDDSNGGIVIPHWERHNSETAKERALAANRQERFRGENREKPPSNGDSVTPCNGVGVTRLEKTREEVIHSPREDADAWQELLTAWRSGTGKPWNRQKPPDGFSDRMADPSWLDDAKAAISHLPRCQWFSTPVTLIQLCGRGFVDKVLAGSFDDRKGQPARSKDFADEKPPPRGFVGKDAARFAATVARACKLKEEPA